ncbi:hypothetical protein ACELLULO517_25790 [Acidisoma cellulosilytica]|uniref:Uncharacterized protein n=1 Tax=Acidisoma cellulosilyticum TaxID=2802395 RepID=A0A963Z8A3_9PROT|nr:hypothetical protein [Acidisoma cellulosilyticum]MCB8883688.1 hypothetical protein [Acidisoma cellulosilyticum]
MSLPDRILDRCLLKLAVWMIAFIDNGRAPDAELRDHDRDEREVETFFSSLDERI